MATGSSSSSERRHSLEEFTEKPLDQRTIKVTDKLGNKKTVPALHLGFVEVVQWVEYRPPEFIFTPDDAFAIICGESTEALKDKYHASIEEWLNRMTFIEDDLTKLLKIPHNRFWSHAVYDNKLHSLLDSFLRLVPRYYDLETFFITDEMMEMSQAIYSLMFKVFLRMSTYKESKEAHITPSEFATLVYENYIFDIPKIIDICVLYQRGNEILLSKMIENIFNNQPKYISDLGQCYETFLLTFEEVQAKISGQSEELTQDTTPRRLDEKGKLSALAEISFKEFLDLVMYTVDISASLFSIIKVYPPCGKVFHQLAYRIPSFFETVFPSLKEEIVSRGEKFHLEHLCSELKKRLSYAKTCLLKFFRDVLLQNYIVPFTELGRSFENETEVPFVEEFLQIICNSLTEKHFIFAYQQRYPIEDDLEMFEQAHYALDSTRTDYILQSVCTVFESLGKTPTTNLMQAQASASSAKELIQVTNHRTNPFQSKNTEGACSKSSTSKEMYISTVREVLPELETNFIEACLEYYHNNTDEVINAIIEGNLPPSLSDFKMSGELDFNLGKRTIFDNDDFDILRRDDVDLSRIHLGKKKKTPKTLDDLSTGHEKVIREVCEKYSIVEDIVEAEDLYEDEYDDTYDSVDLGLQEPAPEDELLKRRPFTMPRVLDSRANVEDSRFSEEEDDDRRFQGQDGNASSSSSHRDEFVQNPEEVRARAEQRRQDRQRTYRQRQVVGNPKGQGQSKDVLRDRQFKERHKSQFSHNRRAQSDFKRSRGMFS